MEVTFRVDACNTDKGWLAGDGPDSKAVIRVGISVDVGTRPGTDGGCLKAAGSVGLSWDVSEEVSQPLITLWGFNGCVVRVGATCDREGSRAAATTGWRAAKVIESD